MFMSSIIQERKKKVFKIYTLHSYAVPNFRNSIPLLLYSTRIALYLSMFNHYSYVLFRMPLSIDITT